MGTTASIIRGSFAFALLLVCVSPTFALDDGDITEPLGGPPRAGLEVLYVNGFNTPEIVARDTAESLGKRLGIGTRLVWNEVDDVLLDAPALAVEKVFDFDTGANAATSTLINRLADRATAGQTTWVVAHSAGTLCVRNAVHELEDRWEDKPDAERAALYDRIRLIHIGGAVFDEGNFWGSGWPEGLRILRINDASDGVAQFVGDLPWGDDLAEAHAASNYLPHITERSFTHHGRRLIRGETLLGEVIQQADDPAEIAARFHVLPMPEQESRRTVNQFIPKDWAVLHWTLSGHPDPEAVTFMPMRDNPQGFDKAGHDQPLRDDSLQVMTGWFHYLGRLIGGIPEEGFWVEARPDQLR